jgi:hypothetical protein
MFYCYFRVPNLWYRHIIRFSLTTCFGLMGPSSGTLVLTITQHTTHTQCVNTGPGVGGVAGGEIGDCDT